MLLASLVASVLAAAPAPVPRAATPPPVGHVWTVVLENKNADQTFSKTPPSPYLGTTLPAQGALVENYYGTGHASLDNYITMISGQAPNIITQADCFAFQEFVGAVVDGQAVGQGCVHDEGVKTVADQLQAKGISWRGYMEDMGDDPAREDATCGHPAVNSQDKTQAATAKDQYATRHNPFMYFHSIIDDEKSCDANVVNLRELTGDLKSVATTPQYSFITPDLCSDGHDATCVNTKQKGGYDGIDEWLTAWIPKILASPAFKQDGLLIVTFDESANDNTACCNEPSGPNTPRPGIGGPGGGRIGAVLLSPFIKPGIKITTPINHYGYLRSIEDLFGLSHLGYAAQDGTATFQSMDGLFTAAAPVPAAKAVRLFRVTRKGRQLTIRVSLAPGVIGRIAVSRKGKVLKRYVTGGRATYRLRVGRPAKVVLQAAQNGRTLKKLSRSR